jgi:hypothetical protein
LAVAVRCSQCSRGERLLRAPVDEKRRGDIL